MTTISPLLFGLAAAEIEKVIVDGLRVKYEVLLQEPAELTFTLVDADGRDLMELTRVRVCSGDSVTLTGIDRALTVVVEPQGREVDLEAELLRDDIGRLRTDLAESQAREFALREAVEDWNRFARKSGTEWLHSETCAVLAVEFNHSALDALLAHARADERERCAKIADGNYGWNGTSGKYEDDLGDAIRALGEKP